MERGKNHYGKHQRPSEESVKAQRDGGPSQCRDCRRIIKTKEALGGRRPRCPHCGGVLDRTGEG
jgi:hypothetical protein